MQIFVMLNEKDLENFLKEKNVNFEIVKFEKNVVTSTSAANQVEGIIIKSILLICDEFPILCILLGKDRIDFEKVRREVNCKDVRLAKAKEVKEITGYDIGALPPIAHKQKITTIIDKKLTEIKEDEIIYCGGGLHYHLLRIEKGKLLKILEKTEIKDISQ